MLISAFARATGLTPDTVRFYVRRGLLLPETGTKGGGNPYQIFDEKQVEAARVIRLAQSLGFSLREIAAFNDELRAGTLTRERSVAIMTEQLAKVEEKAGQLQAMAAYLRAKVAWLEQGSEGPEPRFADHLCGAG